MRGTLQARDARLPITQRDLRWPSWPSIRILRRRQVSGEELEIIERLSSEQRRACRSGEYRPDAVTRRNWH
jgi:hypothetical protein